MRSRELDFFVGETRGIEEDRNLEIIPLPSQQGYFCCRRDHPLTKRRRLSLEEIFSYPLATMWVPKAIMSEFAKALKRELTEITDILPGVIQCDDLMLLMEIVSYSEAVGLTTTDVLNKSIYRNNLAVLPFSMPNFSTHYGIVCNKGYALSPAIELLQKIIIEVAHFLDQPSDERPFPGQGN